MGDITTGRLLARVLRAAGVDAVYGRALPGVPGVVVDEPVAALLAAAHRRVHGRPAAVYLDSGVLVVGAPSPGRAPSDVAVGDDLLAAVPLLATGPASLRLTLDLDAPVADVAPPRPAPVDRWIEPERAAVDALLGARRPVVLAGPGVVADGAVPGLHALAAAASLGVLNTWGAKGVFDWRSRHHLATAGLQQHDFTLAGLGDADLIVATGVDAAEAPDALWRDLAPVVDVLPSALDPLSWPGARPPAEIPMPPLRTELARVTQEGWASTSAPLAPTLVTRHYGQAIGGGGLVAADPGVAGYWVARTFATTDLGGAHGAGRARRGAGSPQPARWWRGCAPRSVPSSRWWTPPSRPTRRGCSMRRPRLGVADPAGGVGPGGPRGRRRRPPRTRAGGRRRRCARAGRPGHRSRPARTAWSQRRARSWPGEGSPAGCDVGDVRSKAPRGSAILGPAWSCWRIATNWGTRSDTADRRCTGPPTRASAARWRSSGSSCSPATRTSSRCAPGRCAKPRPPRASTTRPRSPSTTSSRSRAPSGS